MVVRELSRLTRDLLVIKIDPGRLNDPEIAAEGERRAAQRRGEGVFARGPDARVRGARQRGSGHSKRGAAAVPSRDDADALDPPAQARAAERSDRRPGEGRRPHALGSGPIVFASAAVASGCARRAPSAGGAGPARPGPARSSPAERQRGARGEPGRSAAGVSGQGGGRPRHRCRRSIRSRPIV